MVRVPQVSQQAGLSAQIQAPGVAPVQDQTGRQLQQFGRGLEIAGQGAQRLGDEITESEDNARIKEADALFADYVRGALNPNDGYRSRLGKDAGEGYKQVQQDIADKRKFLAGTLRNDRQRQLFDQTAQVRTGQAQGVIDGHAAQQTRVYEMAETAASIEGRKADYQASLGDPAAMALHMQLLRNDVADLAEMTGRGPKEAKHMLLEQETAMHGAVTGTLIDSGDLAGAADYLSGNKKNMAKDVHAKFSGQVTRLRANQRSADMAATIVGKAPKGSTITERRLFALEGAHAAISSQGLDEAAGARLLAHLDKLHANEVELYATRQNAEVEQALEWFGANPQATFEDYPRSELLGDSGGSGKVLKMVREQRAPTTAPGARLAMRLLNEGFPIDTGPFKGMKLGDLTPAQFQSMSVGMLSPEDQKTAEGYYARARGEATREHYSLIEDDELIERTLRRAGFNYDAAIEAAKAGTESSVDLQRFDAARKTLQAKLNAAGVTKDTPLAEKQSLMDAWVMDKVKLDEFGFDDEVAAGELLESDTPYVEVLQMVDGRQQRVRMDPRKISQATRATVIAARRSKGLPVTEQLIAQDSVQYEADQARLEPSADIEEAYREIVDKYGNLLDLYIRQETLPYIMPDGMTINDQQSLQQLIRARSNG